MQSLSDLNYWSRVSLELEDSRHSGIRLDRALQNVSFTANAPGNYTIVVPAVMTDLINYGLANVRYAFEFAPGMQYSETPNPSKFYVFWGTGAVSENVGFVDYPGGLALAGFREPGEWNAVKSFFLYVPPNFQTLDTWYVRVKLIWYDSAYQADRMFVFDAFDPRYYPLARLGAGADMISNGVYGRSLNATFPSDFGIFAAPIWAQFAEAGLVSDFGLASSAIAGVIGISEDLFVNTTSEATPNRNRGLSSYPAAVFASTAEFERMYNTAVAPSRFAYTEDAQADIQQAIQDSEFAITAWRPEEEFELTIDSLTNSDINTYPTHQRQPDSTGLGVEAAYQGCATNPFDNRIVAVGAGVIKFSDDLGATFTAATVNGTAPGTLLEVKYNAHLKHWITIDTAGLVYLSTDGATWDYTSTAPSTPAVDIAYKPGYGYVITRGGGRNFAYSVDGTAWSTIPGTSNGNSIAYSETRDTWVAAVTDGVMYSTDAVNWTLITLAAGVSMNGVVWTGSEFVVVGSSSVVYRSPDGIEWTAFDAPPNTKWRRIAHHAGGNILMAVAAAMFSGNRVMISLDRGVTWTQLSETLAVVNVCATRDGFFVASTTGVSRGFRWHFNVPRLMPSAIRVSGTPAEIETALAVFSLEGAVDHATALTVNVKLTHVLTDKAVYFDEVVPATGTALANATFPNLQSANYTEDSVVNVGQLLLNNGFAITDTAADNAYEIQIGCTPIGYGAAADFNSLVTVSDTNITNYAVPVADPTHESAAGSADLIAYLNEPYFNTLKTSADRGQTWVTRTMPVDTQTAHTRRGIFYSTKFNQWYLSDYDHDTNAFQIYQTTDFDTWTAVGSIPADTVAPYPNRTLRFISTAAGDLFFVLTSELYDITTRTTGMNAFATVDGLVWGGCFHPIDGLIYKSYGTTQVITHGGRVTAPALTKEHIVFGAWNRLYAYPIALVPNTVSGTRTMYDSRRTLSGPWTDTFTRNGVEYYISLSHIYAVMAGPHGINLVALYRWQNQNNTISGDLAGVLHSPSIHLTDLTEATGIDYALYLPSSWNRVPAVMSPDTGVGYIGFGTGTPGTVVTFATVDGKTWFRPDQAMPSTGTYFLTAAGNSVALIAAGTTRYFKFTPIVGESGGFSTSVITGTDIANLHAQLSAVTWQGSIDSYENQLLSIQAKSTYSGHNYGTGAMRLMGQAGSNCTGPSSTSYTRTLPFTTNGFGLNITDTRAGNVYFYKIEPLTASGAFAASGLQFGLQFTLDTTPAYYDGVYHPGRDLFVVRRQHDFVSTTAMISYTLDRGQTWVNSTWTAANAFDAAINSVIITDTSVIAVTAEGRVYETTDFATWTLRSQITNGGVNSAAAVMNGVFYVGTTSGIVSSTNLVNWTLTTFNGRPISSISVDGNRLAACGHSGGGSVLAVYNNGQWTVNYPSAQYIHTVCVDGDRVYASFGQTATSPGPTPVMVFENNTWSVPTGFNAAQLVPNRRVNRIAKHPITNVILMSQAAQTDSVIGIAYASLADRSVWSIATKAVSTNFGFMPLGNDFAYFVTSGSTSTGGLMQSLPVVAPTFNGQTGTYYDYGNRNIVSSPVSIDFTSAAHTFRVSVGSTVSGRTYYSGIITINRA